MVVHTKVDHRPYSEQAEPTPCFHMTFFFFRFYLDILAYFSTEILF